MVDKMITVDGKRIRNLLEDTQLTSFDYNTEKPIAAGTLGQAYGYDLVPYASTSQDPLLVAAAGERNLLVLAQEGIVFGKGVVSVRIEQRIDMFGKPWQIVAEMATAALRTEGVRVQKVRVAA
jgi:hypothetical protein